jgi:hypothetical protein
MKAISVHAQRKTRSVINRVSTLKPRALRRKIDNESF